MGAQVADLDHTVGGQHSCFMGRYISLLSISSPLSMIALGQKRLPSSGTFISKRVAVAFSESVIMFLVFKGVQGVCNCLTKLIDL